MKLTVITDEKGQVIGAMKGHVPAPDTSKAPDPSAEEWRGGLMAGPGQQLHEIEGPDELERVEDPNEFHRLLTEHIRIQGLQ